MVEGTLMNTTNVKAMPRDLNIENRKLILDFMKDGQPCIASFCGRDLRDLKDQPPDREKETGLFLQQAACHKPRQGQFHGLRRKAAGNICHESQHLFPVLFSDL